MGELTCSIGRYPRNCWVYSAWSFLFAVILLVAGAALSSSAKSSISGVGIAGFVIAGILVVASLVTALLGLSYRSAARTAQACLRDFEKGTFLVHWKLESDDLRNEAQVQFRQRRKNAIIYFAGTAGGGGGFAVIMGAVFGSVESATLCLSVMVPGCVGFLLLGWLIYMACMGRASRKTQAVLSAHGELFIGIAGLYASGDFLGWGTPNRRLLAVKYVDGSPPTLEFTVERSLGTWAYLLSIVALFGGQTIQTEVTEKRAVAISADHATEARATMQYFNQGADE